MRNGQHWDIASIIPAIIYWLRIQIEMHCLDYLNMEIYKYNNYGQACCSISQRRE